MNKKIEANVILCKCIDGTTFGIRIEKINGDWLRTWAFPISDKSAKSENYDKTQIQGSLSEASGYEGCPHCHSHNFFVCGKCGKMNCYDGISTEVTCQWCGNTSSLVAVDSFNIDSTDY